MAASLCAGTSTGFHTSAFGATPYMTAPLYLLERIARHGSTAQRLLQELESDSGELGGLSAHSAIAFDVADLVWVLLCLRGNEEAQATREVRNEVAEALMPVLEKWINA